MQEGNVVSRCIYIRIWPVFAQKGLYLTPKTPIQYQKAFQALNNYKNMFKNKKNSDRPTLFYFGMRA